MHNKTLNCLLEFVLQTDNINEALEGSVPFTMDNCESYKDKKAKLFDLIPELEQLYSEAKGLPVSLVAFHDCYGTGPHYMDTYDVILKGFGPNKLKVMQFLRSVSDYGLSEVLKLELPKIIFNTTYGKEAESLKNGLELLGADVVIEKIYDDNR